MRRLMLLVLAMFFTTNAGNAENKRVVRGFADVQYSITDASEENSTFSLGQFDSYSTGNLGEEITYLTELVVEYSEGWVVDLERLWIKYYVNDALKISFGKFHTPLGFWNRAYHHVSLLHTSIDRPLFLLFEDEGGILPIHTMGMLISGTNISSANIFYDIMLGNGLGSSPVEDNDDNKSISAYFHSKFINGADLGISIYKDKISSGAETEARGKGVPLTEDIDQLITGVSAVLQLGELEVLTEFMKASNKSDSGSSTAIGYYLLGSYGMGRLRPFIKYDLLQVKNDDIYYHPTDKTIFSVGLKFDINFLAAVKLQFSQINDKNSNNINKFTTQFSVGF